MQEQGDGGRVPASTAHTGVPVTAHACCVASPVTTARLFQQHSPLCQQESVSHAVAPWG